MISRSSRTRGDIITGIVQRTEHRNVLVDLSKVEAILPLASKSLGKLWPRGALKVYVTGCARRPGGPRLSPLDAPWSTEAALRA